MISTSYLCLYNDCQRTSVLKKLFRGYNDFPLPFGLPKEYEDGQRFNLKFPEITIPKPRLSSKVTVTITKVRLTIISSTVKSFENLSIHYFSSAIGNFGLNYFSFVLNFVILILKIICEPSYKRILLNYFSIQVIEFQKNFLKSETF